MTVKNNASRLRYTVWILRREDDEGVLFHNGGGDLAVAGFIESNGFCSGFA